MEYDGQLISEHGVKRYLKGVTANQFANINPMQRPKALQKQWEECNFGCHGPTYRVQRRVVGVDQMIQQINKASPLIAGGLSGVKHELHDKPARIGAGVQRTAEGLGASGKEGIAQVGAENYAAYKFVRVNVAKLLNADFTLLDNPLCQLVFSIVHEYVSLLPSSMLESMIKEGALVVPDSIDKNYVLSAIRNGLAETISAEQIDHAAKVISSKGQFLVGKELGKKVTRVLAVIIAVKITKKIMRSPEVSQSLRRNLSGLRESMKNANKGLVTALVVLLNANGFLGLAAAQSRKLQTECPTLWKHLRYDMGGLDMMLFLIRDFVAEYIDRIAVLENNPQVFLKLMAALVKEKKTKEIFFPK